MPAEYERLVKKLKQRKNVDNAYALAHYIQNKGGSRFDLAMSTAKAILGIRKAKDSARLTGLSNGKPDSDFDADSIQAGIKVEMEHTDNREIAKQIAKDHLTEDKDYYKKLAKMESKTKQAVLNIRVTNLHMLTGADFKEDEHPRKDDGKFTCKTCGKEVANTDKDSHEKEHAQSQTKLKSKDDIVKYILDQKSKGKNKDEIFEDLVDNHQVNNVFARSTVESIRWDTQQKNSSGMNLQQIMTASLESYNDQHATYFLLAGDEINGRGWGVTEQSIPQRIETFKGMPFVITTSEYIKDSPYGKIYDHPSTEHFDILGIAPIGSFNINDVNLIKQFQNFFRIGEIVEVYFKDGIWRCNVTKDEKYSNVPWPPFCSPAIYKNNPHEKDGQITDWFGLHLAGLDMRPAYGNIAILKAVCNGPYGVCSHQLKSASMGQHFHPITPCHVKSAVDKIKEATQQLAALDSGELSDTQVINLLQSTTNKKKRKYLSSKEDPHEFSKRLRNVI